MIIPNKIKIGGHIIEVKLVDAREEKDFGTFDDWFRIIRINNDGTNEDVQAEALLHEIFTAIMRIYNLEDKIDHLALTIFSEILFAVFRDNQLDFSGEEVATG